MTENDRYPVTLVGKDSNRCDRRAATKTPPDNRGQIEQPRLIRLLLLFRHYNVPIVLGVCSHEEAL
jgi:hypothetical protein